jgi:uncharacterized membrane protein YhdT
MNENKLQSAQHSKVCTVLRVGGPVIAGVGLLFMIVGFGSFFASFVSAARDGEFGFPRFFWCAFVGMPLLFVGIAMCMFGYLGAFQRYVAGESAPVAKDVVNYMGENVQPGVKAVAKAITEGVIEAQKEEQQKP